MDSSDSSNAPIRIDVEDELEGEHIDSTDYFFVKIGEAVPLKPSDSSFDLESLPSQPLAVSERFRLIFVAHSSGFFVARTKDVMDSAKEIKEKGSGCPIQQLSLVDVSIGKVHILALSTDNSMVAASVSGDILFFSVDNLLNKEVKQSYSCSLNDSSIVEDMRWITTSENSYVVLSDTGKLYYGEVDYPLKHVMDDVDAVEWGIKGKFVAVARKNVLSILSTKFEEQVSISLSFRSWIGDSEVNCSVRVDSIKWIRPDSIIIGCFQLTEDGKEENYLLQVIKCRDGEITNACSELVVQSFCDIYQGLIDDIVPFGSGPYLLLSYLKQCQIAISANRKNTDQHIVLLRWPVDNDNSEAVVVDIERDNWVPRIELQENGEDNLVLGLCVDNISIYQKVGVQLGVEERTELSPCCVLICLTLEGRLVMFHVASVAGNEVSPEVTALPDEEKDAPLKLHGEERATIFPGLQKQDVENVSLGHEFQDVKKNESTLLGDNEPSFKNDLQASEVSRNLKSKPFTNPDQMPPKEDIAKTPEVESVTNLKSLKSNEQKIVPDVNLKPETDGHSPRPLVEQSTKLGSLSSSASLEKPFRDLSRTATQKHAGLGSSTGSFTVKGLPVSSGLSSNSSFQETSEMTKVLQSKSGLWDLQRASHPSSGEKFSFPKHSDVSSFSSSSYAQDSGYQNLKPSMGAANIHASNATGSVGGNPFHVHGMVGTSPAVNFVSRSVQSGEKQTSVGAGNVEQLSIRSSQLTSHESTTAGKSSLHKFHPSNEHHGTSSMLSSSDSNLTRQFGNINDMTKELDQLLRSIEEDGGFRDACTRLLRISIEELEKGMDTLSQRSKMWTSQVNEHLKEVHYLLDKTVQVVARKIYMEGIFNQASDSRYWDLWNRQKLNSELELKRQHILSLNQDLTNQLIELERHFNALELNKFSEYGGTHVGHGAFQSRYGPSRYIQSVYSLHNAMSSQLVAAENLSERLSKQMAALSVKSQSEEQKNVKKELFETIGIPYEASFSSPDVKGVMKTPSSRKLLLSDSSTIKDKSRRNQASAIKSCEAELSRRRRDSLDQSWTCFEPPKTTVKRMLLQEVQKPNLSRSFFSMNKENASLSMLEKSAPPQTYSRIPSTVSPASGKKAGTMDGRLEEVSEHSKAFTWTTNLPASTKFSEFKSPMLQRSNVSAVPSRPASKLSPAMVHGQLKETQDLTVEKSNTGIQKFDLISNGETKPVLQMEMPQKSSISTYLTTETSSLLKKSSEMSISNGKMTTVPRSTKENKPSSTVPSKSWRKHDLPFSASSNTISVASTLIEEVNQFNVDKSQPSEKASAVPTLGGSSESPSSLSIQISSASPLASSVTSAEVPSVAVSVALSRSLTSPSSSIDASEIMSTSSATASASPVVSLTSLSNQGTKHMVPSFTYSSPSNPTLEALKSEAQPASISELKTDSDAAKKAGLPPVEPSGETKLKLEASGKWGPSGSSNDTSSAPATTPNPAPSDASISQPEPPTDAPMQLSTSFPASIVTSGKNEGLDVGITDEDDMEEEAPEMSSSTTELSLGSLGGFGIGSMPNSSTPKSNPFGVSFSNTATSSTSTFSVPSGELFRPASFTFPSPQSSAPAHSTNSAAFSGGFSAGTAVPVPTQSVFGQPAQIGSGQQALGSVLGTFGQSRQLGSGLPGSGFAAPSGFGGGFAGSSPTGGFSSAAPGGGFASIGSTGGGFAGVGSTGGGFAGIASSVGGFAAAASTGTGFAGSASAGSGFAAVPPAGGFAGAALGGGFGAFSSQGSGGFSGFGSGGVTSKPPELFTQMRK